jgi:hypothetical protein
MEIGEDALLKCDHRQERYSLVIRTAAAGGLGVPGFPCSYLFTGWRYKKEVGSRHHDYSILWWHLPIQARGVVRRMER